MSHPLLPRLWRLVPLAMLTGCITVQNLPSPTRDVFTFSFSVASEMQAMAEKTEQSMARRPSPYKKICIEWNEAVTVPDMLSVIEAALRRRQVDAQVYAPGTVPNGCVTLVYAATRAWEEDSAYLSYASIALQLGGKTLSKVSYEPRMLSLDRWASTEAKLIFLLDELISQPPRPAFAAPAGTSPATTATTAAPSPAPEAGK